MVLKGGHFGKEILRNEELSSVHALTLIFIRKIFILQTYSLGVFIPPPTILFCYGAEICPALVQLIGHCKCHYWVHKDVSLSSHM